MMLRFPLLTAAVLSVTTLTQASDVSVRPDRTRGVARSAVSESVRKGTVTVSGGQTAITSVDRKWDEVSGTGTVNEAAVTPDGRIATRESNLTRERDGTITERGTLTDFDGRAANFVETTKRTGAGAIAVGRMVDVDGNIATYETTVARIGRNQTKSTTVITRADGRMETRVEVLAPAKTVAGS